MSDNGVIGPTGTSVPDCRGTGTAEINDGLNSFNDSGVYRDSNVHINLIDKLIPSNIEIDYKIERHPPYGHDIYHHVLGSGPFRFRMEFEFHSRTMVINGTASEDEDIIVGILQKWIRAHHGGIQEQVQQEQVQEKRERKHVIGHRIMTE
jgi:hypothetical protein